MQKKSVISTKNVIHDILDNFSIFHTIFSLIFFLDGEFEPHFA